MANPFDYVKSFNDKGTYLLDSPEAEKEYAPWIVNKALSFMKDTVLYANEMNKYWGTEKKLQHDFFFYGIPKGKRFGKWLKKEKDEKNVVMVATLFGINRNIASQYVRLMSEKQLNQISELFVEGGRK
jgi:hypothetical protein